MNRDQLVDRRSQEAAGVEGYCALERGLALDFMAWDGSMVLPNLW
jgi:hypothetical protein